MLARWLQRSSSSHGQDINMSDVNNIMQHVLEGQHAWGFWQNKMLQAQLVDSLLQSISPRRPPFTGECC